MTSPSDLTLLRVYLPPDLVDDVHKLARSTGLPVRKVVRGILELGLPFYLKRWKDGVVPSYDDELSERPYQGERPERRVNGRVVAIDRYVQGRLLDDLLPPYDESAEARGPG